MLAETEKRNGGRKEKKTKTERQNEKRQEMNRSRIHQASYG